MLGASLLEVVFALALEAAVLASLFAALTTALITQRAVWDEQARLFVERQVEHLVDQATAAAGAGPSRPAALAELDAARIVVEADANGDGIVDPTSAERTAFSVRSGASPSGDALVHEIGRQSMRIAEPLPQDARLEGIAADGTTTWDRGIATAVVVATPSARLTSALVARLR